MSAETRARQQEVAAMFDRHGAGYRWWAVLTVMLGTVSAIMEATVVNVALPEIIRVFDVGHDQVQLLSTGFLAATTASMLLATWAMQRFGIRRTFVGALLLLVMFSVLATLSDRFELLALCRIGQGSIAGLIQPLSMLVIIDVFPLHPLLDFSIFREEGFGAAVLVAAAYGIGIYGSTYLAPIFAQIGAGFSAYEAGLILLPGGAVLAIVLLLAGRLADRFPSNRVAMAGLAFFSLSAILMGFSSRATGLWLLALWVAIGRVGLGLIIPGLNAGALRLLPHGTEASGSASINFFRQLGGALGVTLLALFLEGRERQLEPCMACNPCRKVSS